MKKNRFLKHLTVLLVLLAIAGSLYRVLPLLDSESTALQNVILGVQSDPLGTIKTLFGGEPTEVSDLRKADLILTDEGHQEYYFGQLSEDEQRVYREMLRGIRNFESDFYLTMSDQDAINHIYSALLKDHPELYWVHNHEKVFRTVYGDSTYCTFSPGYLYNEEERASIDASMEAAYQEVLSQITADSSEYDITRVVYSWVIDHTEYVTTEHDQSIAGVFWKQEAVCAGYAGAVQYLLERLGISVIYVEGDSSDSDIGHAWNIVMMDGQHYIVDATNGDQPQFLEGDAAGTLEHKTLLYDYLCPFPEEYAQTYTSSSEFPLPECTAHDNNFYVLNGACFWEYNWQTVYDLCTLRIDNNAAVIRFKFATDVAFAQAAEEWTLENSAQEIAKYYMEHNGLTQVQYHYGVLENLKTIYYIF